MQSQPGPDLKAMRLALGLTLDAVGRAWPGHRIGRAAVYTIEGRAQIPLTKAAQFVRALDAAQVERDRPEVAAKLAAEIAERAA